MGSEDLNTPGEHNKVGNSEYHARLGRSAAEWAAGYANAALNNSGNPVVQAIEIETNELGQILTSSFSNPWGNNPKIELKDKTKAARKAKRKEMKLKKKALMEGINVVAGIYHIAPEVIITWIHKPSKGPSKLSTQESLERMKIANREKAVVLRKKKRLLRSRSERDSRQADLLEGGVDEFEKAKIRHQETLDDGHTSGEGIDAPKIPKFKETLGIQENESGEKVGIDFEKIDKIFAELKSLKGAELATYKVTVEEYIFTILPNYLKHLRKTWDIGYSSREDYLEKFNTTIKNLQKAYNKPAPTATGITSTSAPATGATDVASTSPSASPPVSVAPTTTPTSPEGLEISSEKKEKLRTEGQKILTKAGESKVFTGNKLNTTTEKLGRTVQNNNRFRLNITPENGHDMKVDGTVNKFLNLTQTNPFHFTKINVEKDNDGKTVISTIERKFGSDHNIKRKYKIETLEEKSHKEKLAAFKNEFNLKDHANRITKTKGLTKEHKTNNPLILEKLNVEATAEEGKDYIEVIQAALLKKGFKLGKTGDNDNGVDGEAGDKTIKALQSYVEAMPTTS